MKFAAYFNSQAAAIVGMWGMELHLNNAKSREVLGIEYTNQRQSVIDSAHSLIATGEVKLQKL